MKKLNDQNPSESYTFQEESNSWSNGYDISGTQYDVARVKWGEPWKMPTKAQCAELYQYTTMSWTTLNGVYCIQLTASNGNSIYLPAVGGVWNGDKIAEGDGGSYWSSTYSSRGYATTHNFKYGEAPNGNGIDYIDRGHAVRPITGGSGGGVDFSSIGGKYTTTDCKYFSDEKAFYEMEPTYEMTITTNTKYPTTVQIYNFWMGKKTITGELNTETGDITIATGQIIDEDETYGNIWVTPYSETLTLTYDKDKRSYVSNYFVPRCNEGHFGCYFIKMVHQ